MFIGCCDSGNNPDSNACRITLLWRKYIWTPLKIEPGLVMWWSATYLSHCILILSSYPTTICPLRYLAWFTDANHIYVAHTYMLLPLAHWYILYIALSTQLVRFLRGTSLSEVVFASKSSFYPAIHWDLSERLRIHSIPNSHPHTVNLLLSLQRQATICARQTVSTFDRAQVHWLAHPHSLTLCLRLCEIQSHITSPHRG